VNRAVVVLAVVTVLVAVPATVSGVGHTVGMPEMADERGSAVSDGPSLTSAVVQTQDNETETSDNETETSDNGITRHRRPEDHGADEDDLGGWLSDQLANRFGEGAIQISEGQYDSARNLFGEEYEEQLGQYIEVTNAGEEEEQRLREAGDKQEELADLLAEFEETRGAYEQALDAGDADRARELARELVALADQIESLSVDLQELLDEIEEITGEDLSEAIESVSEVSEEIKSEAQSIAAEQLTETELDIDTAQDSASFLDPLEVNGTLTTADGDPIANNTVRLRFASDVQAPGATPEDVLVTTDENGSFTATYRPTSVSTDISSLEVEYIPAIDSEYLGSSDSVTVHIEQVEPALTLASAPDTVSFGTELTVSGDLGVEDIPVDGVPLEIRLGGQRLGTVHVSNGSFTETVVVPATVPDGERELTVQLPYENRALAGVDETRAVTVEETATALSTTAMAASTIEVNGTLQTVDSVPVADQPVYIRLNGTDVTTVRTTDDGAFAATIEIPDELHNQEVTVTVVYQGSGANLAPSQDEHTVVIPPGGNGEDPGQSSADGDTGPLSAIAGDDTGLSSAVGVILGLGVVLVLAGIIWLYRRESDDSPADSQGGQSGSDSTGGKTTTKATETASLLDQATEHLQRGRPDRAVQTGYVAVRRHLESELGITGPLTHWEFYRNCQHSEQLGENDGDNLLRSVTERYERATFGSDDLSIAEGERALTRARQLCGIAESEPESSTVADD
jgi:hypothetical protein